MTDISNIQLPGDSADYHILTKGVQLSASTQGLSCEIGLRRGGGSKHIIDAIADHCPGKVHIAVDPYGHIEYEHKEAQHVRLDYTNDMLADCMHNIYPFAQSRKVQFIFLNLEDTEFFTRYADGVPVYNLTKRLINNYSFVHFDGPHATLPLTREIEFFHQRALPGACWVFDDVIGYYNHDEIERYLFSIGWRLIEKTPHKALYQL
jgi:hypothetical protein